MSFACVLLMTEGVLTYRNMALFHCLSPIMNYSARVKLRACVFNFGWFVVQFPLKLRDCVIIFVSFPCLYLFQGTKSRLLFPLGDGLP